MLRTGLGGRVIIGMIMVHQAAGFNVGPGLAPLGARGRAQAASCRRLSGLSMAAEEQGRGHSGSRREFSAGATAALISAALLPLSQSSPAEAKEKPGDWARHAGPFTPEELEGFSENPSGLKYKVVEEGTGVVPKPGAKIKAHYAGYLLSNGKKFDASYDRGKPLPFAVGTGQVIKGWDEGLLQMKVGEKRIMLIPPELGYGDRAVGGGLIPAKSTLVFYVELVSLAA